MKQSAYIYRIKSMDNAQVYVGKTRGSVGARFKAHQSAHSKWVRADRKLAKACRSSSIIDLGDARVVALKELQYDATIWPEEAITQDVRQWERMFVQAYGQRAVNGQLPGGRGSDDPVDENSGMSYDQIILQHV